MNNENNVPEMPKKVENNTIQDPIVIKSTPQEEKKPNEAKQMMGDVKETTSKEVQSITKFLNDIKKYITTKNSSELLSLLWRLLLVAGFVILLFLPFELISILGKNIFILFGIDYTIALQNIWESIWIISYCILAFVLFIILCKERYYNLVKLKEDEKKIMNEENK